VCNQTTRDAIAITAIAGSENTAAAIRRADRVLGDNPQKSAALRRSGLQLIRLALYQQAANILSAGIQGQQDAVQIAQ
jgi:hypothetical protein